MKKLTLIVTVMILAGCSQQLEQQGRTIDDRMKNPLFAERYGEELVEHMVELAIRNDPIFEDEAKKSVADEARRGWLVRAKEARAIQREGAEGTFIPMHAYTTGQVLYVNDRLYFGSLFETVPGPFVHIFLTTVVDPRDSDFPDETALDLGLIQSAYGSQTYVVPSVAKAILYRTAVLWDTKLEQLHGFAQLN